MSDRDANKGQTIIEVLVALTTAAVIVAAITLAVITGLRNSESGKAKNLATRYAQEGMEFVRFMRDANFYEFSTLHENTLYCLAKGGTSLTSTNQVSCGDNVDIYSRSITFDLASEYCAAQPTITPGQGVPTPVNTSVKVTVVVSWTDSQCPIDTTIAEHRCHKAQLVSCLSDYTTVSTPGINVTNTPTPTVTPTPITGP